MSVLRVGIIGCGFISPVHIGGYGKCNEVEIVALCDIIEERAQKAREDFGLKNARIMDTNLSLLPGVNGGAELRNEDLVLNGESCDHLWQTQPAAFGNNDSAYDREIAAWVDAVVNDREPIVKCEQGAQVVKVLEAIYQSARNGGKAINL